MIIQV